MAMEETIRREAPGDASSGPSNAVDEPPLRRSRAERLPSPATASSVPALTDPTGAAAPSAPGVLDRWALARLNDSRDLPFIHLMARCAVIGGLGIGLYFTGPYFWYLAPAYVLLWAAWTMDRFILMLHCTSHRQLFKAKHRWLNQVIPWLLGPFHGETPETYFAHHMGMHHREENLPADTSSTMKYQRDRLWHWLRYWGRFMLIGPLDLARYFRRRGNKKLLRRMFVGEYGYIAFVGALMFVDPRATLVVFVFPVLLVRTLMMMGNWGQHAFVCQEQPENPYRASITCINTRYNQRCFNDGYHIHHHVRARCHWTEYPIEFSENQIEYGKNDAIVFEGVDFFMVWLYLMTGRWGRLADAYVPLPGAPERSRDEIIGLLKSRVVRFSPEQLAAYQR